ncbi:MAG: hypothetical protein H0W90_13875 [Actinobacteria bacterium]|nr:hypothetical protein [Actinomycetota bacterium]
MTNRTMTISEREIRALLEAFAGPPEPVRNRHHASDRISRRTLLLAAASLFALVVAVPALALHGQISQTINHFLADKSTPENAKEVVGGVSRAPLEALPLIKGSIRPSGTVELPYTLTSARQVLTANTPQGEIRLYELTFSNDYKGSAMVSLTTREVGGAAWGPDIPCPSGWALKGGSTQATYPGRTPLYVTGRIAPAVASVDVVYPDGHTTPATLGDGYFLASVLPEKGAPTERTNFSPPVTLVAHNSRGQEIGHLRVRSDGDIPPSPGQPAQAVACG